MADIDLTHNHTLGKDAAKQKAEGVLQNLGSQYGIKGAWSGDVFNINKPVEGKFTVTDTSVRVELTLGFMMRAIKGKIEGEVRGQLQKALG
jgi:putative polyhydroxyalkanoate system protein